jgi:serralysin
MFGNTVGGNDNLLESVPGDLSSNTLYGDAYQMSGYTRGGGDYMVGGDGTDYMYGDALTLDFQALGGSDQLIGGLSTDYVYGDAVSMLGSSQGGNDWVRGGQGNDFVYGDAANISGNARGGNDKVWGEEGNDTLYGDGSDAPRSAGGNDVLVGGTGDDVLWGNGGNDIFVFAPGDGQDIIRDFTHIDEPGAEQDKIDLSAYGFASFDDVPIYNTGGITGWAGIALSPTDHVLLAYVNPLTLTADDFIL